MYCINYRFIASKSHVASMWFVHVLFTCVNKNVYMQYQHLQHRYFEPENDTNCIPLRMKTEECQGDHSDMSEIAKQDSLCYRLTHIKQRSEIVAGRGRPSTQRYRCLVIDLLDWVPQKKNTSCTRQNNRDNQECIHIAKCKYLPIKYIVLIYIAMSVFSTPFFTHCLTLLLPTSTRRHFGLEGDLLCSPRK